LYKNIAEVSLNIVNCLNESANSDLAEIREGLLATPKRLLPKFFYDDLGSRLFDRICELPEYYPTRIEHALLEDKTDAIVTLTGATEMVELGSGIVRKTHSLIEHFQYNRQEFRYVPLDISEAAMKITMTRLAQEYPKLDIDGFVCDYTHNLPVFTKTPCCLAVFLGGTVGNFSDQQAHELLTLLRSRLRDGDWLLMGTDLVKSTDVLEAAYNDSQGLTAEFNLNILNSFNQLMNADFNPNGFRHQAFFNSPQSQIEMYLASIRPQQVFIGDLDLKIHFTEGEWMQTEISRKFTRETVDNMLYRAGFKLRHWFIPDNGYFSLSLSQVQGGKNE
jgi:L-histidine N-alpha-methyltransferase